MMPFWIALQFLTIFPIQLKSLPTPQQNAYSLIFYPVIGGLLGGLLYFLAWGLLSLHSSTLLISGLVVSIWVGLTGGLHLDGLADTADAWVGGYGDRERTLTIMKDPQCGPIGVLSLVLVLLLKCVALETLLQTRQLYWLIVLPVMGRFAVLFLFLTCQYVRQKGLGSGLLEYLPRKILWSILVVGLASAAMFNDRIAVVVLIFCCTLFYLRHLFVRHLGGITGDTIGASIEISECICLVSAAILSSVHFV